MKKTIMFMVYHNPTVHMCCNVADKLDKTKFKSVFVAYEEDAKQSLEKRNIPYYSKSKPAKKIIQEIEPDLVITPHNLNPIGYLMMRNAKRLGIKTLLLHEGGSEQSQFLEKKKGKKTKDKLLPMDLDDALLLLIFKINKCRFGNLYVAHSGSDVVAVMSEKAKKFMQSLKIKSDIVVTGQPRFDDIINKKYDEEKIRKKYKIKKKKTVLLLTSIVVVDGIWSPEKLQSFIITLNDITKELDYQLIIKIHPREKKKFYEKIDSNLKIITDDLYDVMNIADVIISIPSTTTLEALMFEKPVIIPDFLTKKSYANELGLTGCQNYDELKEMIQKIPKDKGNIEEFVYKTDGKSSERVANLIGDLL